MFKTAVLATLSLGAVFAAIPVLAPSTQSQQPGWTESAALADSPGAEVFDRLSMGPDPGGKTGDAATPTAAKTTQPSTDGPGASSQSGASSTAPPPGATTSSTDPIARPATGSETPKH